MEINYLTEKNTIVVATEGDFIHLMVDGKKYENVQLVRTFPFTARNEYISVRDASEDAVEIGIIENLEKDFHGQGKEALENQLEIRYFTPKIQKIISIKDEAGCSYFEVNTDGGICRFVVRSNDNSFTKLTEMRIIIEDLENNRFEIPDINKLTIKERKKLDIFL